jgi:hypothetical protein
MAMTRCVLSAAALAARSLADCQHLKEGLPLLLERHVAAFPITDTTIVRRGASLQNWYLSLGAPESSPRPPTTSTSFKRRSSSTRRRARVRGLVAEKRRARLAKQRNNEAMSLDDYVFTLPQFYSGPPKPSIPRHRPRTVVATSRGLIAIQ